MGLRHVQAARDAGLDVVGGCDRDAGTRARLPADVPLHADLDALLAAGPEALVVATNGPSHAAIAGRAMEAGVRRLLIEKPLGTSLRDARAVQAKAAETGTRIVVGVSRRYSPFYDHLADWLGQGPIGPVRAFRAALGASGPGCNGTHLIDLGLRLLGAPPARVWGRLRDVGLPNPRGPSFHDPGGWAVFETQDGGRLHLEMSDDFGYSTGFDILGRWGRVHIDELQGVLQARARDEAGRTAPLHRIATPLADIEVPVAPPRIDITELAAAEQADLFAATPPRADAALGSMLLQAVVGMHMASETGRGIGWDEIPAWAGDREFRFT